MPELSAFDCQRKRGLHIALDADNGANGEGRQNESNQARQLRHACTTSGVWGRVDWLRVSESLRSRVCDDVDSIQYLHAKLGYLQLDVRRFHVAHSIA